jgi:uncharacterized protein (TIGR02118 family)
MICISFLLRRRPGLSEEEFHRYWREEHGPLVRSHAAALGIRRYSQLHAHDPATSELLRTSRDCEPAPWDGIALVWFDSIDALAESAATPEARDAQHALFEDEQRFLDLPRCQIWCNEEQPMIE